MFTVKKTAELVAKGVGGWPGSRGSGEVKVGVGGTQLGPWHDVRTTRDGAASARRKVRNIPVGLRRQRRPSKRHGSILLHASAFAPPVAIGQGPLPRRARRRLLGLRSLLPRPRRLGRNLGVVASLQDP